MLADGDERRVKKTLENDKESAVFRSLFGIG